MTRRVVVVGDAVLDRDVVGRVERLCPDAPVPVVDVEQVGQRPGGAALAALLLAQQGLEVTLAAGIGHDEAGLRLRGDLLGRVHVHDVLPRATTPAKTRVRSGTGPMLRLDDAGQLLGGPAGVEADEDHVDGASLDALLAGADGVLVADYGGPVTRHPRVREAVRRSATFVPVVWDPHPRGLLPPPGVQVTTPNRAEALQLLAAGRAAGPGGTGDESDPSTEDVAAELGRSLPVGAVVVTDGAAGAVLGGGTRVRPQSSLAEGTDTCGAGDRFAGRLLRGLVEGRDVPTALADTVEDVARWLAAGGVAGATRPAEAPALPRPAGLPGLPGTPSRPSGAAPPCTGAVADEDVDTLLARVRAEGGTVVATGGCFDVLHVGHLRLLEEAAALGTVLVVLLNSDAGVRRLKGPTRPVNTQVDRARLLRALGCVDAVRVFDEADPTAALERLRPDVWVKGGDYTAEDLPEAATVTRHGGRVALVPLVPGRSTTAVLAAGRADPLPSDPLPDEPPPDEPLATDTRPTDTRSTDTTTTGATA